ncbi:MAG: Rrf2 family transcriptional regulator [Bryobacterales bacterium]|nr:Rrf2 family transcriptional regulator [Bryobacterales bacterium]
MGDSAPERVRISLKAQYALRAVFDLSLQPPGRPVKISEVARRQGIPQKFLELILAGLKQGGFVESRRGAEGGYLLARSPETITAGAVIRFIEGTQSGRTRARRGGASPFESMWRRVDEAFSEVVDKTSFAELARSWQEQQRAYIPYWEI